MDIVSVQKKKKKKKRKTLEYLYSPTPFYYKAIIV